MRKILGKKCNKKLVAVLLVVAIVITGVNWEPMVTLATELSSSNSKEETVHDLTEGELEDYIVELEESGREYKEVEGERTLNSTTYELTDGIKKLVQYSENVRFEDETLFS